MKLIYCPKCQDVVRLIHDPRQCQCGASGGHYKDSLNAVIWGEAVPLCLSNHSLLKAISSRELYQSGAHVDAWVPPFLCETIKQEWGKQEREKQE